MGQMKIAVITRWYQEIFFAPFFLNHYSPWVDDIYVLLEKWADEKESIDIIKRYTNAHVILCDTGKTLNDKNLSDILSDLSMSLKCDWVIRADADEYTFPYHFQDPRKILAEVRDGNVINTWYRWVYRHETEGSLDTMQPTILQRRHGGQYTIWPGMGEKYKKPTIVKPECKIRWNPGDQSYQKNSLIKESKITFDGVHWQMADVEQAIKRNIKNESRLSEENIKNNWGVKNFTPEMIRKECESHLTDPQLF
jgi:hypothetical protein